MNRKEEVQKQIDAILRKTRIALEPFGFKVEASRDPFSSPESFRFRDDYVEFRFSFTHPVSKNKFGYAHRVLMEILYVDKGYLEYLPRQMANEVLNGLMKLFQEEADCWWSKDRYAKDTKYRMWVDWRNGKVPDAIFADWIEDQGFADEQFLKTLRITNVPPDDSKTWGNTEMPHHNHFPSVQKFLGI